MSFTVLCFSGGLDSVALGILLRRQGHEVEPVYISHRHGGNVTKKEAETASRLALAVCGRPLVVVKPPTQREGWWDDLADQVVHASRKRLPITKDRKKRRNREFLRALRETGVLQAADHVALGILGLEGETEFLSDEEAEAVVQRLGLDRVQDVTHEDLEYDAQLEPGQLISPASLGIVGKTGLLRAVGQRNKDDQELCWSSESCLMYFNTHCGDCASCKSRVQAFMEAWGRDRTAYRPKTFAARRKRRRR